MSELETLISKCEYHARRAAEKHDFFVAKSQRQDAAECAKNTLDWATMFADIAEQLKKLLPES